MESQKPKLLFIDDEARLYYTQWNYYIDEIFSEIKLAEDSDEGLKLISEFQPDFILLDYLMPTDGLSVLEQLKSRLDTLSIDVIMISEIKDDADVIERAFKLGAIGYIGKSDGGSIIKSRLQSLVRNFYRKKNTNQVFISYAREDEEFAIHVKDTIEARGLTTFFDLESLRTGVNWRKMLQNGIENCDAMVLILSPASVNSQVVEDEYNYFLELQKEQQAKYKKWEDNFYPLIYRECNIPFEIRKYQHKSCIENPECIDELAEELVTSLLPSNTDIETTLDNYFRIVDTRQFNELDTIFHEDIVYERPGYDPIIGIGSLIDFYINTRVIASGQHTLDEPLIIQGNRCVCSGRFIGKKHNGEPIDEHFLDFYIFKQNLIVKRKTYFFREAV